MEPRYLKSLAEYAQPGLIGLNFNRGTLQHVKACLRNDVSTE